MDKTASAEKAHFKWVINVSQRRYCLLVQLRKSLGFSKNYSLLSDNASESCAVITGILEVCLRPKKRQAREQAVLSFIQLPQREGHFDFRGPMAIIWLDYT